MSDAPRRIERYRRRARTLLQDPAAVRRLLEQVQAKLGRSLAGAPRLQSVAEEVKLMAALLRAWASGEYTGVARQSVLGIAAALLYFVVPLDAIPDFLLGYGFIDDVAVISYLLRQLQQELEAFRRWQRDQRNAPGSATLPSAETLKPAGLRLGAADAAGLEGQPDADDRGMDAVSKASRPGTELHSSALLSLGLLLATCVLLLQACSLKLIYDNADRFIRWGVSDFVELTAAQRRYLDGELERLLYWHRTTQLPLYAGHLDRLHAQVAAVSDQPAVVLLPGLQAFGEVAESWGDTLLLEAQRTLLQVLLSLTDEQLAALAGSFQEANDEFAEGERGKSLEAIRSHWAEEYEKLFKRFTGRLEPSQRAVLKQYAERYEPQMELWVAYRERWQQALLELLLAHRRARLTALEAQTELLALTHTREAFYGEFGPVFERNELLAQEAAAAMLVALTERQRRKLAKRMDSLTDTLRELLAQAPADPPPPLVATDCLVALPTCP